MKDKHSRYDMPVDDDAMVSKHHNNHNHAGTHPKDGARNNKPKPQKQQQQQQHEQEEPTAATKSSEHRQQHHEEEGTNKNNSTTNKKFEVGIVEIASNLSDLSGSTGDEDDAESSVASGTRKHLSSARNADAKEFEVLIQAKHGEACKAMGVSYTVVLVLRLFCFWSCWTW